MTTLKVPGSTPAECVPLEWIEMEGVVTSSSPPKARVDKNTYVFPTSSAQIFVSSNVLAVMFSEVSFKAVNVASVKLEITDAADGLRGDFTKPVTDNVRFYSLCFMYHHT